MNQKKNAKLAVFFLAVFLLEGISTARAAVLNPDHEDFDYIAEHMAETAMNNRFLTLPDPQTHLAVGWNGINASFFDLRGFLLSGKKSWPLNESWSWGLVGFWDEMKFQNNGGQRLFYPLFNRSIPLDLPEQASFSNLRGTYDHMGAGLTGSWKAPRNSWGGTWQIESGLLVSQVNLTDYKADFIMLTGSSAGQSGTVDHSAAYTYFTSYAGIQYSHPFHKNWNVAPRFRFGIPLPRRSWKGSVTTGGTTTEGDTQTFHGTSPMGDPFAGFGMTVMHAPSGLGLDMGASVSQALFENHIHKGIARVVLITVIWTGAQPKPPL